jgi:hypothetical protein
MRREARDLVTRELLALAEREEHRATNRQRNRIAVLTGDAQIQRGADVAGALLVHRRQIVDAVARGRVTEGIDLYRNAHAQPQALGDHQAEAGVHQPLIAEQRGADRFIRIASADHAAEAVVADHAQGEAELAAVIVGLVREPIAAAFRRFEDAGGVAGLLLRLGVQRGHADSSEQRKWDQERTFHRWGLV